MAINDILLFLCMNLHLSVSEPQALAFHTTIKKTIIARFKKYTCRPEKLNLPIQ